MKFNEMKMEIARIVQAAITEMTLKYRFASRTLFMFQFIGTNLISNSNFQ